MKVLISSRSFGTTDSGAIELLKERGITPILNPYGKKLSEKEIINLMQDSIGIIAGTEVISEKIINQSTNLKVISRYGIGLDNVDLKAAEQKNILVYNTPETPKIAVAELTFSLILSLLKKIVNINGNLKKGIWKPEIGNLLNGKTVGIIGLGRIGKQLVKFLSVFDVKIIAYEINPDINFVSDYDIELTSFEELIIDSDIISIHAPLTNDTKYLIGEKEFKKMKHTAVIVNTARGGLINEEDLYNALKNNIISGAAIDVFENEPDTGKLKEVENIILTPHVGTYTIETRKKMEIEAAENLLNGLKKVNIL